jgi:hypothetical protein
MDQVSGRKGQSPSARRVTAISAIALGALVSVSLGIYAKAHVPTGLAPIRLWFQIPGLMKVWLTRAAAALACVQLASGLRINGHIGFPRRIPSWVPLVHRVTGTLAVLLAVPVGLDCVAAFGFHSASSRVPSSARVLSHGLIGFVLFGAFAAKVVAVQRRQRPRWLIPTLGGVLFVALILLWITSLGWPVSIY